MSSKKRAREEEAVEENWGLSELFEMSCFDPPVFEFTNWDFSFEVDYDTFHDFSPYCCENVIPVVETPIGLNPRLEQTIKEVDQELATIGAQELATMGATPSQTH